MVGEQSPTKHAKCYIPHIINICRIFHMPGPKRINPDIRYAQEVMLWRTAEQHGSISVAQPSPAKAINLRHRLNTARAVYRDMTAGAWLEWDNFAVKLNGNTVIIERKVALDLGQVYVVGEDGNQHQLSMTDIMLADEASPSPIPSWQPTPPVPGAIQPSFSPAKDKAEMAKIYEETRPASTPVYKGHSGVFPKMPPPPETFDPNAPLDLEESE
jgi:hypothetical protein